MNDKHQTEATASVERKFKPKIRHILDKIKYFSAGWVEIRALNRDVLEVHRDLRAENFARDVQNIKF